MTQGIYAHIWDGKKFCLGWMLWADGIITHLKFNKPTKSIKAQLVNAPDSYLIPGFVDTLLHGYSGVDCGSGTVKGLKKLTENLVREGVTTALAGFYPTNNHNLISAAKRYDKLKNLGGARTRIAGWHVEGPFISRRMAGALPKSAINSPSRNAAIKFVEACGGWLKMSTVSPELSKIEEVQVVFNENGVCPSVGHTRATYLDCQMFGANGVIAATHLGNRMLPLSARELGPIGFAMKGGFDWVSVIPDGVHVDFDTLALWAGTSKLKNKLMACSDNLSYAGTRKQLFSSGGKKLHKSGCVAVDEHGGLAGTLEPLSQLLLKAKRDGLLTLAQVINHGCSIPGDFIGDCGRIQINRRADFVQFSPESNTLGDVWVLGERLCNS